MKPNNKILIIGKPQTGKSCLKGQLYTRLSEIDSKVKKYKDATNIEAVKLIADSQAMGLNPDRTSDNKDIDAETAFHLEFKDGAKVDLIWPDYAGEKINDIINDRKIKKSWSSLIQESSVWMLFIRLDELKPIDNLLLRPQENVNRQSKSDENNEDDFEYEISDYAFFVELLQMLLFQRGLSSLNTIKSPALQIVLTFWDDLIQNANGCKIGTPREELFRRCPMLVEFIESTWDKSKVSFMGLSPQGMSLAKDSESAAKSENIQDFTEAPEEHGYIITDEGKEEKDLTALIQHAIKLAR